MVWNGDDARGLPTRTAAVAKKVPGDAWYQPKSLWSIGYFRQAQGDTSRLRLTYSRNMLRNGTRWPCTLLRLAISPINYPIINGVAFNQQASEPGTEGAFSAQVLADVTIRINSPYRRGFSRQEINTSAYPALNTGQPKGEGGQSSLWGISYLKFDIPTYIGKNTSCAVRMAGYTPFTIRRQILDPLPVLNSLLAPPARAFAAYYERGGLFSGGQRLQAIRLNGANEPPGASVDNENRPQPDFFTGVPFGLPGMYGNPAGSLPVINFPPESSFSARSFTSQGMTSSGSSEMYGASVMIDQREYDDFLLDQMAAEGYALTDNNFQLAPLSMRIGSEASTSDGVSNNEWWTPGAPLCLTYDTITPALVYELPQPITLGPGEGLQVEASCPHYRDNLSGTSTQTCAGQVGISFNGYSKIEG